MVHSARGGRPVSWDLNLWSKGAKEAVRTNKRSGSQSRLELFEEIVLPHLNAAYNLARWLTQNDQDAQDVVQESYLRAYQFFGGYRGGDGKAWLLAVVRNTCRTWQRRQNRERSSVPFDEAAHSGNSAFPEQERETVNRERADVLRTCIEMLPAGFREVVVMRELEEMSYEDIAETLNLSRGTVMSRLFRARKRLEECAASRVSEAIR